MHELHPAAHAAALQVRDLLECLPPNYWTSSELRLVNRPTAPIMLLVWKRPDVQAQQLSRR